MDAVCWRYFWLGVVGVALVLLDWHFNVKGKKG